MVHATRTFWSQAEALEFISKRQKKLIVQKKFYIYSVLNHNQKVNVDIKVADIDVFI
jgi:hypothetical protein